MYVCMYVSIYIFIYMSIYEVKNRGGGIATLIAKQMAMW